MNECIVYFCGGLLVSWVPMLALVIFQAHWIRSLKNIITTQDKLIEVQDEIIMEQKEILTAYLKKTKLRGTDE